MIRTLQPKRTTRTIIVRRLTVVGCFALLASACGGDGDAERSMFGAGEHFSIASALQQLPADQLADGDSDMAIYVADLLSAGEATGQARPTGSIDAGAAAQWLGPMTGTSETVFVPVPDAFIASIGSVAEYRDEVGFAVTDVDATIEVADGARSLMVLAGALEPNGERSAADGVLSLGAGDDFEVHPAERTPARPLGMPLRIASHGDLMVVTPSTETAGAWLDEGSTRLDRDEDLALAAEILDETHAIGAALVRADDLAFDLVALGWGVDEDRAAITVVYVEPDEAAANTAEEAVDAAYTAGASTRTGRPIADLVIVDDVTTRGRAVVASLHLPPERRVPRTVLDMLMARDTPFAIGASPNADRTSNPGSP